MEEEEHIFALNPTWLDLKINLSDFGENAEPLLDGECFFGEAAVTADKNHEELFKDMNNVELDVLIQECLEMMSCRCSIVVNNQLTDQPPGGSIVIHWRKYSKKQNFAKQPTCFLSKILPKCRDNFISSLI